MGKHIEPRRDVITRLYAPDKRSASGILCMQLPSLSIAQLHRHFISFRTPLLILLFTLNSNLIQANPLGYSQAELKALQRREIAIQAPEHAPLLDLNALWQNAKQFEAEMRTTQQDALSPILKQANIGDNPNSAAKGVIIFASLTMPSTTLKQLMMQSRDLQVPIIIRGVLPQGFPATVAAIQSLVHSKDDEVINSGMAINSLWFKQLGIQYVPTFAVIKPGACLPKQPCQDSDFDVLVGNVSLYDALATLARDGEVPNIAQQVLSRRQ